MAPTEISSPGASPAVGFRIYVTLDQEEVVDVRTNFFPTT
jgi:hypothetical protein